jgi:DNA-binding transcriptional ArsR family regulator
MSDAVLASARKLIDAILEAPAQARAAVLAMLANAPKPNGHDPHPPDAHVHKPRRKPGKPSPAEAREAERQALDLMRDHPGLGVGEMAKRLDVRSSALSERLKRLSKRGLAERDETSGKWRVAEARPTSPPQRAAV